MDQSVDSALFFFPFFLVLNCTLNSLDFFVFCISLSLYFPLALSLRMSFLFYGSLSEGYIPALCRLMPTRTSKIIIIIISARFRAFSHGLQFALEASIDFFIKTHDLSFPFWPCGYECVVSLPDQYGSSTELIRSFA